MYLPNPFDTGRMWHKINFEKNKAISVLEFSFSLVGFRSKAKEPSLNNYFVIVEWGDNMDRYFSMRICSKWNANSLVQVLNSGRWFYFL